MRNLSCTILQCDEIWSFVYAKPKKVPGEHNGEFGYGDVCRFTAIDVILNRIVDLTSENQI